MGFDLRGSSRFLPHFLLEIGGSVGPKGDQGVLLLRQGVPPTIQYWIPDQVGNDKGVSTFDGSQDSSRTSFWKLVEVWDQRAIRAYICFVKGVPPTILNWNPDQVGNDKWVMTYEE